MKILPQKETLALIASFRESVNDYSSSTQTMSERLVAGLQTGDYKHPKPKVAIAGLQAQQRREAAKRGPASAD